MTYKINDIVVIHNLIKSPEYNNMSGKICTSLKNGRYGILLENYKLGKLFKIENIKSNLELEIINKTDVSNKINNIDESSNQISDKLKDIKSKLDIIKNKTNSLYNSYYQNFWCMHPDCLTSLECFNTQIDLNNHMKIHNN